MLKTLGKYFASKSLHYSNVSAWNGT